jgi:hypothetical protein
MNEAAYQLARRRILNAYRRQQRTLDLCGKQLTALPPEIGQLTGLRQLNLSSNQLTALPAEIGQLTELYRLYLEDNQLTELPPEIGQLTGLRDLNLSGNQLTALPAEIGMLTALDRLYLSGNQLTALPTEIGQLTALDRLYLEDNRLTALPKEIGLLTRLQKLNLSGNQLTALPAGIGKLPLGDLDVTENPLPPPYPRLMFDGSPFVTTRNVLVWLQTGVDISTLPPQPGEAEHNGVPAGPPPLPPQGAGPHFEIDEAGIVTLAPPEALDREGNHVRQLRSLHPTLRDLSCKLGENLLAGNAPHGRLLGSRVTSYKELVDQDLDKIDFALLYIEGVRLANAEAATSLEIERRELPQLDALAREQLSTILQLHGRFILSTAEGIAAIELEERYQRRPDEERQYRAAAVDVARSLQNRPDIIDTSAASVVLGGAEEIGRGARPERGDVAGTGALRNIVIAITSVATLAALPVSIGSLFGQGGPMASYFTALAITEGLKRTRSFSKLFGAVAGAVDCADAEIRLALVDVRAKFRKHLELVRNIEPKLRRVVTMNEQFSRIGDALDRLLANEDHRGGREP